MARYGRVDLLVNAAAVQSYGHFDQLPWEHITRVFDVTCFGCLRFARAVPPHFRAEGVGPRGRVPLTPAWLRFTAALGLAALAGGRAGRGGPGRQGRGAGGALKGRDQRMVGCQRKCRGAAKHPRVAAAFD